MIIETMGQELLADNKKREQFVEAARLIYAAGESAGRFQSWQEIYPDVGDESTFYRVVMYPTPEEAENPGNLYFVFSRDSEIITSPTYYLHFAVSEDSPLISTIFETEFDSDHQPYLTLNEDTGEIFYDLFSRLAFLPGTIHESSRWDHDNPVVYTSESLDDILRTGILFAAALKVSDGNTLVIDENAVAALKAKGFFDPKTAPSVEKPKPPVSVGPVPGGFVATARGLWPT